MFVTDYNPEFKKRIAWYDGFCPTCGEIFEKKKKFRTAIVSIVIQVFSYKIAKKRDGDVGGTPPKSPDRMQRNGILTC